MVKPSMQEFYNLYQQNGLTPYVVSIFRGFIWQYYREHGRTFPWRETHNPYHILVSEIMLQQTQTSRVVNKYAEFVAIFPDFFALANASLREVLQIWQGLGYNRRALALQRTAQEVVAQFDGQLPIDPEVLRQFPGIGQYTAAAVAALAFNKPTVFIETNIRSVFLHYFYWESERISDREILSLVEATLERANPREWYYALFDNGAMLKRQRKAIPGVKHYKQSLFQGSNREIRGHIIRLLLARTSITKQELVGFLNQNSERVGQSLAQLQQEGLIKTAGDLFYIR